MLGAGKIRVAVRPKGKAFWQTVGMLAENLADLEKEGSKVIQPINGYLALPIKIGLPKVDTGGEIFFNLLNKSLDGQTERCV